MSIRVFGRYAVLGAFAAASHSALAADPVPSDFYDAAICQPPFSIRGAIALYNAARKITKPDTSMFGTAIVHLPEPVSKDGFTTQDVVFTSSSIGVLVDGEVADQLALRYKLAPEKGQLLGASSKGFSRELPDAQGPMGSLLFISARQSQALKGKTLLACEYIAEEDLKKLEQLDKGSDQR